MDPPDQIDGLNRISEEDWVALRAWADGRPLPESESVGSIPFAHLLSPEDLRRFRADLLTVLTEHDLTGEPIDSAEIADILREFADSVAWDGPLWSPPLPPATPYTLAIPTKDLKTLRTASPAARRVVEELLGGPLARNPSGLAGEITQRVKKMPDRELWQVYLPDGFRLSYIIDEAERTVHIVYLGPHSDSHQDGRGNAVRQEVHRRRLERNRQGGEPGD